MASSDDFRKLLKAGNINEALAVALSKAVDLKITTWVAPETDDLETGEAKPGHRMRTHLNLIEAYIENEIGDQFIANGRYRELRQFHLEQVAEANKMIQSNLKSLQKLFEVMVAMRYQATTPPVIEPESPDVESQLLPSTEQVTEAELVIEPHESAVDNSISSPDTLTQENAAQAQPLPPEVLGSFLIAPTDTQEALDSETDEDDWDDSLLDLLESLPVGPRPGIEASELQMDEDWSEFVEQRRDSDLDTLDSQGPEDWGILTLEDLEPSSAEAAPHVEASSSQIAEGLEDIVEQERISNPDALDSQEPEDWGILTLEDLESSPVEAFNSQVDEDWGDIIEQEPEPVASESQMHQARETLTSQQSEPSLTQVAPHIEAFNSQVDEDWGDIIEQEPEPAASGWQVHQDEGTLTSKELGSPPAELVPHSEVSSSQVDEDWGDMVEQEPEPGASDWQVRQEGGTLTSKELDSPPAESTSFIEASNSQVDEDWGWEDMVERDLQTVPDKRVPSLDSLDLEEDDEWDDWVVEDPEPLPDEPIAEMDLLGLGEDDDWGDLLEDSDPFAAPPRVNRSASDLEIDDDWDDFSPEELEPYSASRDLEPNVDTGFDLSSSLEDLTDSELAVDNHDSKPQSVSQEHLDAKSKSVQKRVPPPPPPSRLPNQNN
jgi:hypothetical protein